MTIEEIRKLNDQDLADKVLELKAELLNFRFQAKAGQLDNGKKMTQLRKDIARLLTVKNERQANK